MILEQKAAVGDYGVVRDAANEAIQLKHLVHVIYFALRCYFFVIWPIFIFIIRASYLWKWVNMQLIQEFLPILHDTEAPLVETARCVGALT